MTTPRIPAPKSEPTKTLEQNFIDWEATAFGYGYGTGEPHIIPLLRRFLKLCNRNDNNSYDYQRLELALGAASAWFLINALCHQDIVEYGTSPRFAWLTKEGKALREFMLSKSADELVELVTDRTEDYVCCYPDACNCGPHGYEKGRKCQNPFWPRRAP